MKSRCRCLDGHGMCWGRGKCGKWRSSRTMGRRGGVLCGIRCMKRLKPERLLRSEAELTEPHFLYLVWRNSRCLRTFRKMPLCDALVVLPFCTVVHATSSLVGSCDATDLGRGPRLSAAAAQM